MQSLPACEVVALLLGLLFGSFLNVCISRLPAHESIVSPRSRCPQCLHAIRWYDNIPLLSWVNLRGRCRDCRNEIPWRYPLVEVLTALWFMAFTFRLWVWLHPPYSAHFLGFTAGEVAGYWVVNLGAIILGFLLLGLLVMDWQTNVLPDAFTLPGIGIGLFLVCVQSIFLGPDEASIQLDPAHSLRMSSPGSFAARGNVFLTGPEHLIFGRVAAVLGAALIPFAIRLIYKLLRGQEGLGLGDVKLMAMIAAFLGFWPAVLVFALGCFFIFPYALVLLARKRADGSTQLPLGSFLAAGGMVAAIMGPAMIDWYKSFL